MTMEKELTNLVVKFYKSSEKAKKKSEKETEKMIKTIREMQGLAFEECALRLDIILSKYGIKK